MEDVFEDSSIACSRQHRSFVNKLDSFFAVSKENSPVNGNTTSAENVVNNNNNEGQQVSNVVPRSIAATPSLTPSSFCSPTTAATATAGTIAGRSGARKSPDNCQPTVNAVPLHPQQQLQKRYQVSEQQHIQQQ
ncbi:homeobox protein 5-like [Glossina fuscipes]|uniref:Homeobox protein 5-like n=1 Tax=Glossina fuscipes TaxID=7396 RepID=A0A9C6E054_9MUSC|nr:homeobox protein 5-like [Glossina fuscipes]